MVYFDARGTGMSERDVAGVSAETLLLDAEAVIDAAKLDRFIVLADPGSILALSTCLRLAIAYPERVTHVVLESPFQNAREMADTSMGKAGLALAELDWAAFLQTLFRVLLGWDAASSEIVEAYVAGVGGWVDQPVGIQYVRAGENLDVSDLLPQVRQPTLVLRNDPYFVPARCCQRVAAKIPGAQFRQYSDPTFVQQAELIRAFVAQSSSPPAQEAPAASPFRTVLFTDLVGHTEMMPAPRRREGPRRPPRARAHHPRGAEGKRRHRGEDDGRRLHGLVRVGDEGGGVRDRLAERVFERNGRTPLAEGRTVDSHVRVGLNAGEPIEEDGDLFGATVILASRIAAKADGGEILVADTVRGLLLRQGLPVRGPRGVRGEGVRGAGARVRGELAGVGGAGVCGRDLRHWTLPRMWDNWPMELRMQYATARDGTRIAFGTAGSGPYLVRVPSLPFSHAQLEWQSGSEFFDQLAANWTVVQYDPRGTGLSDRNVQDLSLQARMQDLEAIVDKLGIETFALHGIGWSGPVVVTYAVRHPERVTHLILDDAQVRIEDFMNIPQIRALDQLTGDWDSFLEFLVFTMYGKGRE